MTPEARALIAERIADTQPALEAFWEKGEAFDLMLLPLIGATIGAGILGASAWKQISPGQRWMLVLCLGIASLGFWEA